MTVLTSKIFWLRSLERAIKTFIQTFVALVGDTATFGVIDADWKQALAAAATTTVLSFLTSLASSLTGDSESPSLIENKVEQQVVEKIEAGQPVGDPEKVIDPSSVEFEDVSEADAEEAVEPPVEKPVAALKKRATAKKRIT